MRIIELNNINESFNYILCGIWRNLSPKRRYQCFFLLILTILSGIAEFISVSSLLPFLTVIADPKSILNFPFLSQFLSEPFFNSNKNLLIVVLIVFCAFVLLSALIRIINFWIGSNLIAKISHELSCNVFKRLIYTSYKDHLNSNSSELIVSLTNYILSTVEILYATLQMITSLIIGISIILLLLFIDWKIALGSFLLFGSIYIKLSSIVKKRLSSLSKTIAIQSQKQIAVVQEGYAGLRDIILNLRQSYYLNLYQQIDWPIRDGAAKSQLFAIFPKYCIESLSLILIAILAFFISISDSNKIGVIPLVGTFALAAQKIIPSMQQVYASWVGIRQWSAGASKIISILDDSVVIPKIYSSTRKYDFKKEVEFKGIHFSYNQKSDHLLKDLNLKINRGDHIGIIGPTGSGKSTLVDILMGILKPTKGEVLIDGINLYSSSKKEFLEQWKLSISHVPQNIYLTDGSISENIAFGIKKNQIDIEKVKKAAEDARISDFINSTKDGFLTNVGERGIQLSGGQCQRIGIARALYKGTNILVFDEATSALDNKTEMDLINSINKLSEECTIISIAHRQSTIANCNKVIKLENGKITFIGKPNEID